MLIVVLRRCKSLRLFSAKCQQNALGGFVKGQFDKMPKIVYALLFNVLLVPFSFMFRARCDDEDKLISQQAETFHVRGIKAYVQKLPFFLMGKGIPIKKENTHIAKKTLGFGFTSCVHILVSKTDNSARSIPSYR